MSKEHWKKRYSFRLTDDDKDIYDFIQSSKATESETIRKMLKFALRTINQEKAREQSQQEYKTIKRELELIREQQNKGFQEVLDRLNNGVILKDEEHSDDNERERVAKSVENSIDSMLDSFGLNE